MWLLLAREPTPDAPYWPGRRLLAAIDAALWPLQWVLVFSYAPKPVGLVAALAASMSDGRTRFTPSFEIRSAPRNRPVCQAHR